MLLLASPRACDACPVCLLSLAVDAPTVADGWVRVINIKPSGGSCPGDLQYTVPPSGRAVCERGCTEDACISSFSLAPGVSYSKVRGYALARQYYSADAFGRHLERVFNIDQTYVDGISLTTNAGGSRTHLWTWAVGISVAGDYPQYDCPCNGGDPAPAFIGDSWFCASGLYGSTGEGAGSTDQWHEDELFNTNREDSTGIGIPSGNTCRDGFGASRTWFEADLGAATTDDLEVRVMSDQPPDNEDAGITEMEVWVYAYSGPYAAVGDGCCGYSDTVTRTTNPPDGWPNWLAGPANGPLSTSTTADAAACEAACSAEPACWGYEYNTATGECVTQTAVPDAVSTCASTTCKAKAGPFPVDQYCHDQYCGGSLVTQGWQPIAEWGSMSPSRFGGTGSARPFGVIADDCCGGSKNTAWAHQGWTATPSTLSIDSA